MQQRILTALVLAPLAIAAILWLPTKWLGVLVGLVLMVGLWEWTRLIGLQTAQARLAALVANTLLMAALAWSWYLALVVVVLGALWWLLAIVWLGHGAFLARRGKRSLSLKLLAGSLAVIPAWTALLMLHADAARGPRWALLALTLVWAADSCAWFAGNRWGRRKLAPTISPGKTWAGLYGGLAGSFLLALLAAPALDIGWLQLPALSLLALVTALFSVFGDLFESLIKRHAGSKDSGALIPGHGGVLDRIDSLLAALPLFLIGKIVLGL